MLELARVRLGVLGFVISAGCAQAPDTELSLAANRVDAARSADAAMFAPEPLARAELALGTARTLTEEGSYRAAIGSAAEAVMHADDAFEVATVEKQIAMRRALRCLRELEGLMAIARSRGAESKAPDELARFGELYREVKSTIDSGDLLGALDRCNVLVPALLELEQRLRD